LCWFNSLKHHPTLSAHTISARLLTPLPNNLLTQGQATLRQRLSQRPMTPRIMIRESITQNPLVIPIQTVHHCANHARRNFRWRGQTLKH
jgi:hypothetical protein